MQPCPRKAEATLPSQLAHESHWREDGTCSYCGSLNPDILFAAIEAGTAELGATDKNYKLYVTLPCERPDELVVAMSTNEKLTPEEAERQGYLPADAAARERWGLLDFTTFYKLRPRGPRRYTKVYFQHFTEEQGRRFVQLHNEKRLPFAPGDGLYVRPFFMRPAGKA